MSVTDYWLGYNTETTATIVCRADATETVTVTCNGQTYTAEADIGVRYGAVLITVTGLSPGTRYDYFINDALGGSLKTKKTSGDLWIGYGSCWGQFPSPIVGRLYEQYDPDVFVFGGDFPYSDGPDHTGNGLATLSSSGSIAASKDLENYYKHHLKIRRYQGILEMLHNCPTWYMPDDHEYIADNSFKGLAWYQAQVDPLGTQQDLDDAWAACRSAFEMACLGNPPKPTGVDADAIYFSQGFHNLDAFVVDPIQYRSDPAPADNADKRMLGATQEAWLTNGINNSPKPWKIWITGKSFFYTTNSDSYGVVNGQYGYFIELKRTLFAIKDAVGVFSVSGDQHIPSDEIMSANELGTGYPAMSSLCACPAGVYSHVSPSPTPLNYVRWRGYKSNSAGQRISRDQRVLGLFRVSDTRVDRYLFTLKGLVPRGYIEAGSNQVQYQRARIG